MSERHPKLLLSDILESAEKIVNYTQSLTYEDFIADSKTIDAVTRNFEIIGEAANRLPDEIKEIYTEIDWYKIRGMRNRIVHNYFGLDYKIIWSTKEDYLPKLINQIQTLIDNY
ncbi:HepT-like ribonuclease domain-containing protein [Mucilaginibacter sp.]